MFKQINNYKKRIADFGKRFLEFLKKKTNWVMQFLNG